MSQPSQDNIDESQTAQPGGSNSKALLVINGSVRDGVVMLVMAISIVTNVVLANKIIAAENAKAQVEDLKRYDLDFFKQNDWVHMKADLEVTKQLIAAKCSK